MVVLGEGGNRAQRELQRGPTDDRFSVGARSEARGERVAARGCHEPRRHLRCFAKVRQRRTVARHLGAHLSERRDTTNVPSAFTADPSRRVTKQIVEREDHKKAKLFALIKQIHCFRNSDVLLYEADLLL